MIDHITLPLANYATEKDQYKAILEASGWKMIVDQEFYSGYGSGDRPVFWICEPSEGRPHASGAHVAIAVDSKEAVQAFHKKALELGWRDNGAPGLRPEYSEDYYGAFVIDASGNNIEAVTFN